MANASDNSSRDLVNVTATLLSTRNDATTTKASMLTGSSFNLTTLSSTDNFTSSPFVSFSSTSFSASDATSNSSSTSSSASATMPSSSNLTTVPATSMSVATNESITTSDNVTITESPVLSSSITSSVVASTTIATTESPVPSSSITSSVVASTTIATTESPVPNSSITSSVVFSTTRTESLPSSSVTSSVVASTTDINDSSNSSRSSTTSATTPPFSDQLTQSSATNTALTTTGIVSATSGGILQPSSTAIASSSRNSQPGGLTSVPTPSSIATTAAPLDTEALIISCSIVGFVLLVVLVLVAVVCYKRRQARSKFAMPSHMMVTNMAYETPQPEFPIYEDIPEEDDAVAGPSVVRCQAHATDGASTNSDCDIAMTDNDLYSGSGSTAALRTFRSP